MKSVGEVMAIGRTFQESMQRRCAPEVGMCGFDPILEADLSMQGGLTGAH